MPTLHSIVKKKEPTPRWAAYDLYWTFASRRQQVFEARLAGKAQPWTDDRILQEFKFCNVFRASDRVSQYMIQKVIHEQVDGTPEEQLFRIVAFRTFSKMGTWDAVTARLGRSPSLADLRSGKFEQALDATKAEFGGLYTGAFILCATKAYGFDQKHRNHVALFQHMFLKEKLGLKLLHAKSLETIVRLLEKFPLTGPFMSYQTAIDLNYSELINFGENDYTQAGPGALRGIKKAFVDTGDYEPAEVISWMVERQDEEFRRLGLSFDGLWGRQLHAIDCQGLFCELDKYCREALPQLASARTRIKARFTPSADGLRYYFPPKWKINERMRSTSHAIAGTVDGGILPLWVAAAEQ
jgi:hypothetical protein